PRYAVMTGIDVTAERTTAGLVNHLMEASLTTAIVGIDTAGRISVANSGIQHLLGYERDATAGESFHRLSEAPRALCRPRPGGGARGGGLALNDQVRRRAAGLDDALGRPGRFRRAERLPVRGPRRH